MKKRGGVEMSIVYLISGLKEHIGEGRLDQTVWEGETNDRVV